MYFIDVISFNYFSRHINVKYSLNLMPIMAIHWDFDFLREIVDLPVRHCKQNNRLRDNENIFAFSKKVEQSRNKNEKCQDEFSRKILKSEESTKIELQFLQSDSYHALTKMWSWWKLPCWSPFTPSERKFVKFCVQMPQKPKGFLLEPNFNNFSAILCPQKGEAVHLDATSEVKMEARSEIYM